MRSLHKSTSTRSIFFDSARTSMGANIELFLWCIGRADVIAHEKTLRFWVQRQSVRMAHLLLSQLYILDTGGINLDMFLQEGAEYERSRQDKGLRNEQ